MCNPLHLGHVTRYQIFRGHTPAGEVTRRGIWNIGYVWFCMKCGQEFGRYIPDGVIRYVTQEGICQHCTPTEHSDFMGYLSGSLYPFLWRDLAELQFSGSFLTEEVDIAFRRN